MTNKEKTKKSFSLIEVLLAVFILEIGLLGISTFYAYSHKIAKMARNQTIATNLAQGVLDEQIAKSYDSPELITVNRTAYSTVPNNPFQGFDKEITITCINASLGDLNCLDPNAHMKKVIVTIYWTEDNSNRSVQLAVIKADNEG